MNYASIKEMDVANGPGIRMSLFVSGCRHYCKGCFNHEAWDFNYGNPFTKNEEDYILDYVSRPHISGFTLLGGEPFELENQKGVVNLLERLKKECPDKSIWCFTGFDFENDIISDMYINVPETKRMLSCIDVLVDGKFIEELKDLSLRFKGSRNQKTILVQESLKEGKTILWDPIQYGYDN